MGPGPLFRTRHRGLAAQLARLARSLASDATILILGAPGTGKDRLARLLHDRSPRADEPFVRVDLAAVPEDLFESEVFGHERGAFTGAVVPKPGLLEGAAEGTIYLDRIDALGARSQGKLLRLLEERLVVRLGGTRGALVRARFVASAAPDLPRRVRLGEFREDLFYRLAAITVKLPPLAERTADLLPAARALLRAAGTRGRLTGAAEAALARHPWRGNFRELANVLGRAALEMMSEGATSVDERHLRLEDGGEPEALLDDAVRAGWTLGELTDRFVRLVLEESGGNVSEAARRLGVARKTVYERLETAHSRRG